MTDEAALRVKRLRYRSWHRGTQELDLLLGPFADRHLATLTARELDDYEALLEAPEPLIFALVTGQVPPPPALDTDLLAMLRAFHARAPSANQRPQ
ncbi:MAG TPA: succinate dehydrogenase assembly factor 2 [Kiloniellales bacterium]|nr:succinate dehydrogenase assembly factor 2 [Kiloniellales bacterium]